MAGRACQAPTNLSRPATASRLLRLSVMFCSSNSSGHSGVMFKGRQVHKPVLRFLREFLGNALQHVTPDIECLGRSIEPVQQLHGLPNRLD